MEHIAALLLVVGCSGNLSDCQELPAPVPVFETGEECREVLETTRSRYAGSDMRVFSTCLDVDPALVYDDAELVWDIEGGTTLVAELRPVETLLAMDRNTDDGHQNQMSR